MVRFTFYNEEIQGIPKTLYFILSGFIFTTTTIITLLTTYIVVGLYRYRANKKNRKKLLFLCISILTLTTSYILQEFYQFILFNKFEILMRDFLFLICFYFFFLDLISIDNQIGIFYITVFLLVVL